MLLPGWMRNVRGVRHGDRGLPLHRADWPYSPGLKGWRPRRTAAPGPRVGPKAPLWDAEAHQRGLASESRMRVTGPSFTKWTRMWAP